MTMPKFEPVATVVDDFDGWTKIRKHIPMVTGTQLFTAEQLQQAYSAGFDAGQVEPSEDMLLAYQAGFKAGQQAPSAVPEGFVLVPIEPTKEMLEAIWDWRDGDATDDLLLAAYKAMLAAAPKERK